MLLDYRLDDLLAHYIDLGLHVTEVQEHVANHGQVCLAIEYESAFCLADADDLFFRDFFELQVS